jgi:hypothetical protein
VRSREHRGDVEHLEQLAREWYEYQGYFVRQDLWVGLESDGSYECELDVVAFHPLHHHIVQIEPVFDLEPADEKELHFRLKFDAGKKYLHRMFGPPAGLHIEQIALIAATDCSGRRTIGGGRVLLVSELVSQILHHLAELDPASAPVPEQWPLIRTLQWAATCREAPSPGQSPSAAAGGRHP